MMDPDTAQVVPKELCEAFFEASGAKLVAGRAGGLEMDGEGCTGVNVGDAVIPCDAVVCAMGAWSVLLEDWIGAETGLTVPLEGVYSSSIVFEGSPEVAEEPCALFCAEDSNACHLEVYPRVDVRTRRLLRLQTAYVSLRHRRDTFLARRDRSTSAASAARTTCGVRGCARAATSRTRRS